MNRTIVVNDANLLIDLSKLRLVDVCIGLCILYGRCCLCYDDSSIKRMNGLSKMMNLISQIRFPGL